MTLTLYEGSPHDPITVSVASAIPALSFNRSDLANTVTLTQTAASVLTFNCAVIATTGTFSGGLSVAGSPWAGYPNGEMAFSSVSAGGYCGISTWATAAPIMYFDHRGAANTGTFAFRNGTGGASLLGTVNGSGFVNASDIRLKTNIKPIEDAIAKVKVIHGVTFNWLNDDTRKYEAVGVIAQEVQAVLPQVVSVISESGTLGVSYGLLAPLLIEAIKELSARLDILEKK